MNLPLWQFGKSRPKIGGSRGSYAVLAAAPEFTDQHLSVLRRIREDAAWRPKGKGACTPVTACWPLGDDNWLLLRFLDDGTDDHHRPNTMRIEAALAEGMPWEQLYRLLAPEVWPAFVPDGATSIDLTFNVQPGETPPNPAKPVLYADPGELANSLFGSICNRVPESKQGAGVVPSRIAASPPNKSARGPVQTGRWREKLPWKLVAALLCLALVFTIVLQKEAIEKEKQQNEQLNEKYQKLKKEHQKLKEEHQKLKEEYQTLDKEHRELREKMEQNSRDRLPNELSQIYKKVREQMNSLSTNLSNAEKDMEKLKDYLRAAAEFDEKETGRERAIDRAEQH